MPNWPLLQNVNVSFQNSMIIGMHQMSIISFIIESLDIRKFLLTLIFENGLGNSLDL